MFPTAPNSQPASSVLIVGPDPIVSSQMAQQLSSIASLSQLVIPHATNPIPHLPQFTPQNPSSRPDYIFYMLPFATAFTKLTNSHLKELKQTHQQVIHLAEQLPSAKWNIISFPDPLISQITYPYQLKLHLLQTLDQLQIDYRQSFIYDVIPTQPHFISEPPSLLYALLNSLQNHHIPHTPSPQKVFPIAASQVAKGIIKATFLPGTKHATYLFTSQQSLSPQTFTAKFKSVHPEYSTTKIKQQPYLVHYPPDLNLLSFTRKQLNWHPAFQFMSTFSAYLPLDYQIPTTSTYNLQKSSHNHSNSFLNFSLNLLRRFISKFHSIVPQLNFRLLLRSLAITSIILFLPFFIHLIQLTRSTATLISAIRSAQQTNFHHAKLLANQATHNFDRASQPQIRGESIYRQIFRPLYQLTDHPTYLLQLSSNLLNHVAQAGVSFQQISQQTDPQLMQQPLSELKLSLSKARQQVSLLSYHLPTQTPSLLKPFNQHNQLDSWLTFLSQTPELLTVAEQIAPLYPQLSGLDQTQTYLVIFQNNHELRPTGGFIGSFALTHISRGKLDSWQIYDVYEADGQLKGYVAPPDEIATYLKEPSWYLRDANWNPDFPSSAATIQWFLQKELNTQVNGVIAIDLYTLQQVIDHLGPLNITEFDQPLTGDNLPNLLQNRIESDFFPGSQTKKSSLSLIAHRLLQDFQDQSALKHALLLSTSKQLADQRHLLFSFNDPSIQTVFDQLHWSGGVDIPTSSPKQFNQLIGTVDANVGVNKVNPYIQKQVHLLHDLAPSASTHSQLTINYTNTSTQETKIQGTYRNYLRIILPTDSTIKSIQTITTSPDFRTPQTRTFEPYHLDSTQAEDHSMVGLYIEIPPSSQLQLDLSYTQPTPTNPQAYLLFLYKQPGTITTPTTITIRVPDPDQATQLADQTSFSLTESHHLTYNTDLLTEELISFPFNAYE